ncbi:MAG: hypothetical protein EON59_00640 [Alphaproteobacteria bacterium]|nr:MAG: hypothetical protein EON59_00640 [Alphaproteobacteria bacterium]
MTVYGTGRTEDAVDTVARSVARQAITGVAAAVDAANAATENAEEAAAAAIAAAAILDGTYIPGSVGTEPPPLPDVGSVFIDTSSPIRPDVRFQQGAETVTVAGELLATLGAEPLAYSASVSVNGLEKPSTSYTIDGVDFSLAGLAVSDVVIIKYAYAEDVAAPSTIWSQPVIYDDCNRADSTTTPGSADSGAAWIVASGVWGISGNKLYRVSGTGTNNVIFQNPGKADVILQAKFDVVTASSGLMLRATDISNGFTTNATGLFRREAGSNIDRGTFSQTFVSGDSMRIRAVGDTIKVYRQAASTGAWVNVLTATDSFNNTATLHGVRVSSTLASDARFDVFRIY